MAFFGSLIVKLIQWSFVFTKYKYISGTGEFFLFFNSQNYVLHGNEYKMIWWQWRVITA